MSLSDVPNLVSQLEFNGHSRGCYALWPNDKVSDWVRLKSWQHFFFFFSSQITTIKYPLGIKTFTPSLFSSSLPVMLMLRLSIKTYQTRGHLMSLTTTPTIPPLGTMARPTSAYLPKMAKLSPSHRKILTLYQTSCNVYMATQTRWWIVCVMNVKCCDCCQWC